MVPNGVRLAVTVAFAIGAIVVFNMYSGDADKVAERIADDAEANETLSESAIQQQVVAAWATRDAELAQIRQNGTRNGLLGICAAMLVSLAINSALRERRDSELQTATPAPSLSGSPGAPPTRTS